MPAAFERLRRRLVVASGEQQQVAGLVAIDLVDCSSIDVANHRGAGLTRIQNAIDKTRYRQRQDRVHVVPKLEQRENSIGPSIAFAQPIAETVQIRIEVVVLDDEQALTGMTFVVVL